MRRHVLGQMTASSKTPVRPSMTVRDAGSCSSSRNTCAETVLKEQRSRFSSRCLQVRVDSRLNWLSAAESFVAGIQLLRFSLARSEWMICQTSQIAWTLDPEWIRNGQCTCWPSAFDQTTTSRNRRLTADSLRRHSLRCFALGLQRRENPSQTPPLPVYHSLGIIDSDACTPQIPYSSSAAPHACTEPSAADLNYGGPSMHGILTTFRVCGAVSTRNEAKLGTAPVGQQLSARRQRIENHRWAHFILSTKPPPYPPMCEHIQLTAPCADCGEPAPTGEVKKVLDCGEEICPWSLYHPLSLYRNGCSIVDSDQGKLLLRASFTNTPVNEHRMRFTMKVNIQPLTSFSTAQGAGQH
uniref:Uncharacterized protein n=1 Tax=Mycena chlorophos TaxID=658473 RepID=A0ABQ0LV60_MYCCL|nr:predicted protein [Mycena chlorophos]